MLRHRITTAGVAGALTLAIAVPALAHTEVKSTSPKRGGTASTAIKSVKVTFEGRIRSGTLTVRKVGGGKVSVGSGRRDPRSVRRLVVGLKSGLAAGRYKANWKMIAADGHEQKGSFRFRLER